MRRSSIISMSNEEVIEAETGGPTVKGRFAGASSIEMAGLEVEFNAGEVTVSWLGRCC